MHSRHDSHPTILLVSNGKERAQGLYEPLTHEGYRVVATTNRALLVRQVDSMAPALLLLDLGREIDPSTRTLLRGLRARPEQAPAILLCLDEGATLEEVDDRELGQVALLAAPWETEELLEQVLLTLHTL